MSRTSFIPRRRARLLATTFVFAAVAAMAAFALARSSQFGVDLEHRSVDWRFQQRGELPVSSDIVILGIDNNTDKSVRTRFPYPWSFHAKAIDVLAKAGAAAIVFDVQFLEPPSESDGMDLITAAARSGKVIFATAPEGEVGISETGSTRDQTTPLPFRGLRVGSQSALDASGAQLGNSQQLFSGDSVRRWINPLRRFKVDTGGERTLPSLSLSALAMAEGKSIFEYPKLPDRMAINYRGPASTLRGDGGHAIKNYSSVLPIAGQALPDLSWAKGKIVLIGATSAVLQDVHETPYAAPNSDGERTRLMPGVEIHAHALETLRKGDWLQEAPPRSNQVRAAVLTLAVWLVLALTPLWFGTVLALGANVLYILLAQRAFEDGAIWSLVPVVSAGAAAFALTVTAIAGTAMRERRHVTGLFARYVSPDVVRELIDSADDIVLGGERRDVTILFSDIRGFTTMSEGLDPAELVRQLNDYFEEMVEAIELQRGTFDKFIGDGLMAMFGAPLHQEDHADSACAAALDMVERLDELNAERVADGLLPLEIGIGIHTGEAIVGNIGSPSRRVDYTAIGDTVNLASRLESNTKNVGARILVSKETAAAASSHVFVERGSIVVKGRTQATSVFELTAEAGRAVETAEDGATTERAAPGAPADGQAA